MDDENELGEIKVLLWGSVAVKKDVFNAWSQGFIFSEIEPSALVQMEGGPCGVIAPVQAFILKILVMETPGYNISDLTPEKCIKLLIQALCNILMKCKLEKYRIVALKKHLDDHQNEQRTNNDDLDEEHLPSGSCQSQSCKKEEWTPEQFHERLTVINCESIDDLEKYFTDNYRMLTEQYGLLLFLYTVLLTKGIENVMTELSDTSEPLIHSIYGYGSQGLINLMITGRAVAHVWDNDQDVGGLKLRGINQQSEIGFITLMEQLRYCTVGSFFKNPKNPVWVMGSETHLTVLFSNEKRLVSPETSCEIARRVFKSYDPEGNNFIPSVVLQDVLCALDLVSEPEYVEIMRKKLDPESLGIILLAGFMDEFFPDEKRSMPDTFDLLHYNGIPGSNNGAKVKYNKGSAILLESDLKMCNLSNPMLTCLQTKWPNIEVNWHDFRTPSLN